MGTLLKLGTGGVLGFLVGILLVLWVRPSTQGGQAILILLSVCVVSLLWSLGVTLFGRKEK